MDAGVVELLPFPGAADGSGDGGFVGAGPFLLPLPPKAVPPHLVDVVKPSAFVTNLWLSVVINPNGFTRKQLRLISKSTRKAELGVGESAPLVIRLGGQVLEGRRVPLCTAVLFPSGRLTIMGAVSEAVALWHASRVAFKVKYRVWWRREGSEVRYVAHPDVRFSVSEARIQQLVVTVDLGGKFKPDLSAVASHPTLKGQAFVSSDALVVRVPSAQQAKDSEPQRLEDALFDIQDETSAMASAIAVSKRLVRNKGPTCLVYNTGRLLVLGCSSAEAVEVAVSFVWPAVVGL